MPGPIPKPAYLKQRRNISVSRRELSASNDQQAEYFDLPIHPFSGDEWHEFTRRWWTDVWSSPQIVEFLEADMGALLRLATLVEQFWQTGSLPVAKEIRTLEKEFGLTPLSRRRLEWSVVKTVGETNKVRGKIEHKSPTDPRRVLSDDND